VKVERTEYVSIGKCGSLRAYAVGTGTLPDFLFSAEMAESIRGYRHLMKTNRNVFSSIETVIGMPIMSFRLIAESADTPEGIDKGWSYPCSWPTVDGTFILLVLSFLTLLNSTHVLAQNARPPTNLADMSLEELMSINVDSVYGASGFEQKVTEAPASVTIITSEEIQRYGYRTLADILRNVPGFYVTYDRNYSYVGVRGYGLPGQYNNSIALMIDGHRINDNIFDGALIGTEFPLDVDLIQRVEVIRGPNSSQYFASAFLGVINIVTKRGRDLPKLQVAGEVASYGSYQGHVSYGNRFSNGLELLLSGSFYDSHGQDQLFFKAFDNPATNNGLAVNADDDEFQQLFTNLSWGGFTLQGVYGSRDKGIPTAPFGSVVNVTGTRTVDVRSYLDLTYKRELGHGWNLTSRTYYDLFNNDGTYVYDYSASGGASRVLNRNFAHGKWWGEEVTVAKQVFNTQRLIVGAEFRDNIQQDQGNYDVQPFVQYFRDSRNSTVFSLYAQDEIRLHSNLILNLGIRYDRYSLFGGTTNPRAALIYNPWEKTNFKFLYGQSFRAPNLFELFYNAPGNEANPSLRPETVRTMELVWEQYFAHHFRTTASAFYYPIRSLISEQVDPVNGNAFFANAGSLNLRGFDFSLSKTLPNGLDGTVSYSFQDAGNASTRMALTNSPKHLVQASLSVPIIKQKVFASMDLQFVSKRATLTGEYSGAYVIPNFTLFTRNVLKGWEISASLYNGINQKYADPAGNGLTEDTIVQDGRTFRIKVGYKFQ
jgi:outer membrane receptor for ferrienterochelin and colicins